MASLLPLMNILGPILVLQYIKELSDVLRITGVREFFVLGKKYLDSVKEELQ